MLKLELLVLVTSIIYIGLNRSLIKHVDKFYVVGLLVIILSAHLIFEGVRWQMIPSYLIWVIALITALRQSEKKSSIVVRILKTIGVLVLVIPAVTLPTLLPVFELPKTTGPFAVGTLDILLELDREEIITQDTSDTRSLMIKAWYPSTETGGEMDLYIDRAGRSGFAQKYGLPPSMLNYLDKVETNVYRDIQIADGRFPILIFSHGYHSKANGYYALLSEVVSHGYVLFAINHTYESSGTTFPDGSEVYIDYDFASQIESGTWDVVAPAVEAFKEGLAFEDRHPVVQQALTSYFVKDIVERWANDIVDVVSELDKWSETGFFKDKMDLDNVGVFGHSRGGGAAGESLLIDERIKAGANLDGVQWGQIVNSMFQKPFLYLSSDWPDDHENLNEHAYVNKSKAGFYDGKILQSGHSNFMDIPFMIPLKSLNEAGDIAPDLAIEITNKVVVSFFDNHLKSKNLNLKSLDLEYEMLKLNFYKGDSINLEIN